MTSDGTHDWRCKAAVSTGISAASALVGMIIGRVIQNLKLRKLVNGNHRLLTKEDKKLVRALSAAGHGHIFRQWPAPGVRDGAKLSLVACLHEAIASPSVEKKRLELLKPPVPVKKPRNLEQHGHTREDGLYWLRDDARSDPEVLAHLRAENDYVKAAMADTEELQDRLFKEMRGRIQEADQAPAQRHGPYYYYSRMEEGKQYAVHCRRRVPLGAGPPSDADVPSEAEPEEVLLDENREAARHGGGFYMSGAVVASPNHRLLAYSQDTSGNEKYTLFVKNLETGAQLLSEPIPDTDGRIVWANDNATLFYCKKDHLDRPFKVFQHLIGGGAAPGEDACVFHEEDDAFYIGMFRSRDDQLLFICSGSAVTSEVRFVSADTPDAPWTVVRARQNEVEYSVEVRGQQLLMALRDASRPNSELLVAPLSDPSNLQVLLPHREDVKLEGFELSADFLAVFERQQGLQAATVFALPQGAELAAEQLGQGERLEFDEPAYELAAGGQGDFDSLVLRLCYTSLTTPLTVLDHHMRTRSRTVKKVQPVLGGFESSNYRTERIWAAAPDGVKVPISLVYNHHLAKLDGSDPLLLDIYGSYEVCNDPGFSSSRLSLLDRGFVFAIAHVRGGGEMGRRWYEDGKYLRKKNTFTDAIACAEHLVASRYTSADRLCIEGRSAGGLTMGAVLNMRPELFCAAVLGVPFVDVLTTMLDESIPLTTIEWEEWGNPVASREFYDYMRSYSPLDNVQHAAYPNMLVTAGLHDPRVGYWEPAKLVAKLREFKTNDSLLLFKCDLGAGHFSQSGRFDRLKEVALEQAFLLKALGMLAVQPFTPDPAQQ